MSSLKNVLKTRTYKERSQPAARARLGLLEKHKDYVLRARDYARKADTLRSLRQKASFKNPDEYYFNMARSSTKDGVHQKQAAAQPTPDELAAFKREDANYLAYKRSMEVRKIEKLRSSLHQLDAPLTNTHTFFADDEEAARAIDVSGRGTTPAEVARRNKKVGRAPAPASAAGSAEPSGAANAAASSGMRSAKLAPKELARLERKRKASYSELEQREGRQGKMGRALARIGTERALQGKGRRKKLKTEGGAPRQYKWRQERKR